MPFQEANGLRFHVQLLSPPHEDHEDQHRPKVVMLHGLVADNLSSYYYTIAPPLALGGADVYLYDLRGHGRSEVPDTGYTVADNVADLAALLDAWDVHEPVHLVGNSFGGVIALAFANAFPDRVASLFLIEAHFAIEGWGEHMAGSLALAAFGLDEQAVKDWLKEHGGRKVNRLARHSERLFMETTLIKDLEQEEPFPVAALQAISCPTFAIYGENSDILDRARDLERYVPDCELYIVPGSTHSVLTESSALVRELAADWLARHG